MLAVTKRDSVAASCTASAQETSSSLKTTSWSSPQHPGAAYLPGEVRSETCALLLLSQVLAGGSFPFPLSPKVWKVRNVFKHFVFTL